MSEPVHNETDAPLDVEELQAQRLRALADLENLRVRKNKEIDLARNEGEERVAREVLPIIDDFRRFLESIENVTGRNAKQQILEGAKHVFEKFIHTLKKLEIEGFKSEGQAFAAELMEAVAQVPSRTLSPGMVAGELAQGFTRRGKLLRPAQVTVAVAEENNDERDPA